MVYIYRKCFIIVMSVFLFSFFFISSSIVLGASSYAISGSSLPSPYISTSDFNLYLTQQLDLDLPVLNFNGSIYVDFSNVDLSTRKDYTIKAKFYIGKESLIFSDIYSTYNEDFLSLPISNYNEGVTNAFSFDSSSSSFSGNCLNGNDLSYQNKCLSNFSEVVNNKVVRVDFPTVSSLILTNYNSDNGAVPNSFANSNSVNDVRLGAWSDFLFDLETDNLSDYSITLKITIIDKNLTPDKNYEHYYTYGYSENSVDLADGLEVITRLSEDLTILQRVSYFFSGIKSKNITSTSTLLNNTSDGSDPCDERVVYASGSETFPNGLTYCYVFLRDSSDNRIDVSSKIFDFDYLIQLDLNISEDLYLTFQNNLQLQVKMFFSFNSSDLATVIPPLVLNHEDLIFDSDNKNILAELSFTSLIAQDFITNESSSGYFLYKNIYIEFADVSRDYIFLTKTLPFKIVYSDVSTLTGVSQFILDSDFNTFNYSFDEDLTGNSNNTFNISDNFFKKVFYFLVDNIPVFRYIGSLRDKIDLLQHGYYTSGEEGCILNVSTGDLPDNLNSLLVDSEYKNEIRICRSVWENGPYAFYINILVDILKVITSFIFGCFLLFRFASVFGGFVGAGVIVGVGGGKREKKSNK